MTLQLWNNSTSTRIAAIAGMLALGTILNAQIVSEDFSSPTKINNAGANAFLGTGGAGFNYNGNFGTWLYAGGNMGIDDAAEGDGLGGSLGNAISSLGMARAQDVRGENARAISVVFDGSLFSDGVEYTVSFDVIGDVAAADTGRYWLAEVSGYDNSDSNYIQIDGTQNGWASVKPFTVAGTASVSFLADSASNGVLLTGENVSGTTNTSFTFTYDATNSPDIAFAVGTYNNAFGIDNFSIIPEPSSVMLLLIGAIAMFPFYIRRRR